ncbi:MAG: glutamine--fructose-6-phosphate transaminase (isomerizing) [Acidobacteria bacterium]|nr:glutamine--fructose-6-phosphate transaminase (isomerizing) [Acidobacteriota bacterium]
MCGIVGYVGHRDVVPILLEGLTRLEYRGYDSAGVAVVDRGGSVGIRRAAGKLVNLKTELADDPLAGAYGIGHTRWATHGKPTTENAHPHQDAAGRIALVHNGIIENFLELRSGLEERGVEFVSETDTEVIVHLVSSYYEGDLAAAVRRTLDDLEGIYAIVVASADEPDKLVTARQGPPIVVGLGENENFIASDVPPVMGYTRDVVFLDDGQLAVVTPDEVTIQDGAGNAVEAVAQRVTWDPVTAEKGGFKHFMLKEIHEQPTAIRDSLIGRVNRHTGQIDLGELNLDEDLANSMSELLLLGCGTSWHAALVGKYWIEKLAGVPVKVDHASEFRYRDPLVADGAVACAITQSGETADTLAATREAKDRGAKLWTICNVVGSMATRISDGVLLTQAGPEIGVASTKAFTTQLTCLYLIALKLAELRGRLSREAIELRLHNLARLPGQIEGIVAQADKIDEVARRVQHFKQFLFIGRGLLYPIALEGALKLKEISYIHAHGYPAGEMKHGPIALIDDGVPIVALAPQSDLYEKTASNMQEAKARDGFILAVATEGDENLADFSDELLSIPDCLPEFAPLLASVPLQLLSYYVAVRLGCDVDQPRNLAKSVTVE